MKFLSKHIPVPADCYHCKIDLSKETSSIICHPCQLSLPYWHDELCSFCGENENSCFCAEEFGLSDLKALFHYSYPINQWITSLKYHRNFLSGRLLKQLLTEWIIDNHTWLSGFDHIEPVPQSLLTTISRGFNQVDFLFSDILKGQMKQLLKKSFTIKHQAARNRIERFANAGKTGFSLNDTEIEGQSILLLDDVCSTGTTLQAAANLFRDAGAKEVCAVVLARNVEVNPSAALI